MNNKITREDAKSINLFANTNQAEYTLNRLAERAELEFKDAESETAKKDWAILMNLLGKSYAHIKKMKERKIKTDTYV